MRILLGLATLFVFITAPAFAEDDFGARFGSNLTVGFEDATMDPEKALNEITPAAGDEQAADVTAGEDTSASEDASDTVEKDMRNLELR